MKQCIVITGLPAAGKTFVRARLSRQHLGLDALDCSDIAAKYLEDPGVWKRHRSLLKSLLGLPTDDFWPRAGMASLSAEWLPHQAAAFEQRIAREIAPYVAARAASERCFIVEATPIIGWMLTLLLPFGGDVFLVRTAEDLRKRRLGERLGKRGAPLVPTVAAFHRTMYRSALFAFENQQTGAWTCIASS